MFTVAGLRLADSKEGASVGPIGLPALECLEGRRDEGAEGYVFQGCTDDTSFGAFPNHWTKILGESELADITPHVLRHSFASIANDLGFTDERRDGAFGFVRINSAYDRAFRYSAVPDEMKVGFAR